MQRDKDNSKRKQSLQMTDSKHNGPKYIVAKSGKLTNNGRGEGEGEKEDLQEQQQQHTHTHRHNSNAGCEQMQKEQQQHFYIQLSIERVGKIFTRLQLQQQQPQLL